MGANATKDSQETHPNLTQENNKTLECLAKKKKASLMKQNPLLKLDVQVCNAVELKKKGYTNSQVLNAYLEDILQLSARSPSNTRKIYKLISQQNLSEFTPSNFDEVVKHMLEAPQGCYFKIPEEKLRYLYSAFIRAFHISVNKIFTEEIKTELMQVLLSFFVSLLTSPETFDPSVKLENEKNLLDLSCCVSTEFYELLKDGVPDSFLKVLFAEISEEDYPKVVTPILKRIFADISAGDIKNVDSILKGLEILKMILKADNQVIKFFYNHPVFLPGKDQSDNPLTGFSFQQSTIFGRALGISILPEDNHTFYLNFFPTDKPLLDPKLTVEMLRGRIRSIVDAVYEILEFIIKHDDEGKRKVADWLYAIIELNNDKQKMLINASGLSSNGFLLNFLTLLLKFSKPFLDDFEKIPQRLGKIDAMYLRERKVFDNLSLLNGTSNFYLPQQCFAESKTIPEKQPPDVNTEEIFRDKSATNTESAKTQVEEEVDQKKSEQVEIKQAKPEEEEEKVKESALIKETPEIDDINHQTAGPHAPESLGKNQQPETKTNFTLLTELVFLTNHNLQLVLNQFQVYRNFINELEREVGSLNGVFPPHLSYKLSLKHAYEVQYGDSLLWELLLRLLMIDALYIAHNQGYSITSLKKPESIFAEFISSNNIPKALLPIEILHKESKIAPVVAQSIDSSIAEQAGMIPSYWAENISHYSEILLDCHKSSLGTQIECSKIISNFMLLALGTSGWLSNPHLKADYLNFLNNLLLKQEQLEVEKKNQSDTFAIASILEDNEFIEGNLLNELLSYYWTLNKMNVVHEMEKYRYRHLICKLFNGFRARKANFASSNLRESVMNLTKDSDSFNRLTITLLQDITSLLDESLQKMKICNEQQEILSAAGGLDNLVMGMAGLPDQEPSYQQNLQLIKDSILYLSSFAETLYHFISINRKVIFSEEMLEKLAHSLNYCVYELLERHTSTLSVPKMKTMNFDPIIFLKYICLTISSFRENEEMLNIIIRDERSYDLKVYQAAIELLTQGNTITDEELYSLEVVVAKCKILAEEKEAEDSFMNQVGDIPEEFLDPLMGCVMKEPVLLPTSGVIIDRTTILKHLMVDLTDPFNRKPLTKEMVLPQIELRDRIKAFFDEKRKECQITLQKESAC